MVKRPNKDSVLVKHKKWLADLQRTKERLAENYLEETRRKEEEQLKVVLSVSISITSHDFISIFTYFYIFISFKNMKRK